jgi:glycosyltransferase involved in cell wall biosynthesis
MPAKFLYSGVLNPIATIVIPSMDGDRNGNLQLLLKDLLSQTFNSIEVIVSIGESPNGHARNVGVELASSSSQYFVFFDDDVRLGSSLVLENLISALKYPEFGLVGASQLPPMNSTLTQKWIAYDLSKAKYAVQDKFVETEMATHAGMACLRKVWEEMGGESDILITGTDTDLRDRLRSKGYRVVVAPQTWVFHPLPTSFSAVLKAAVRNGWFQLDYRIVHGFQTGLLRPFKPISNKIDLLFAIAREIVIFFPHVFLSRNSPMIGFRPLNAIFRLLMVTTYTLRAFRESKVTTLHKST